MEDPNRVNRTKPSLDRLAGMMIAHAVGDALGAPHEFKTQRHNVYTGYLYIAPEFVFRSGRRKDVIGQYTDDHEETLCIIRSAIERGRYDRDAILLKYMDWAKGSKALGKNTRALFKGVKTIAGYQSRYDKIFKDTDQSTWTQSNGSLMRCSPLAFLLPPENIVTDCMLTNPHPVNINSNVVYCYMIKWSALGYPKDAILSTILGSNLIITEIKEVILQATSNKLFTRDVKEIGKGWVLHGLYCAVWGWYHFNSYQEPIDAIIMAGGDTDTNAAIAGALIGVTLGYERLLKEERTNYNIKMVLTADYSKGENPRPPEFTLHDFPTMIQAFHNLI